ncbi:pyridoxal-dependent decarboxylase [Clostridioides sp. ES-S-0049-02]|uniref:diaminopimelate decarboxylase family protein n=1 Tax=Clostridioides sp. ES-S-0049-02 TaxID=2770778 RepID=UPI001D11F119|nr:pyridoxal-dependent decarboxylase [Clostridioides sp. ES-S-0049-02]
MYLNQEYSFIKEHAPCYIYDEVNIIERCMELKNSILGFDFLYSIKTNPYNKIVKSIAKQGFGTDAASMKEVLISKECGVDRDNIYYSAPGKLEEELEAVLDKCIIIADSITEIELINKISEKQNKKIKIGIRINPAFTMDDDSSISSKFGIDIEDIDNVFKILNLCNYISVVGIHIHIKSQVLDFEKLGCYYEKCFLIALNLNKSEHINIEFINFGSGIGVVYDNLKESPVNLKKLSILTEKIVSTNANTLKARLFIESGRFVVCTSGNYYTKIVDIKVSRGIKYLVVRNGLNGFMRPIISNLIEKVTCGVELEGQEPLYTSNHAFYFSVLSSSEEEEYVTIVGNLCTSLDVLANNVKLKKAVIGDVISINNAGSYSYSLSPLMFSSYEFPKQYYRRKDGWIE